MTKETLFEQIDEIFSDWHGGEVHIGQEREELIKEVLEKAINYTHCCEGLRDEYLQPELDKYKNIKIERTKGKSDM